MELDQVKAAAAKATPSTTGTTKAGANRFHDDKSNYTGAHRLQVRRSSTSRTARRVPARRRCIPRRHLDLLLLYDILDHWRAIHHTRLSARRVAAHGRE